MSDVDYVPDSHTSAQFNEADADCMTNWRLCFDHEVEPDPSVFFSSFVTVMRALHFVSPVVDVTAPDEIVSAAVAHRHAALSARLHERRGQVWSMLPRCVSVSLELEGVAASISSAAPPRSQRRRQRQEGGREDQVRLARARSYPPAHPRAPH